MTPDFWRARRVFMTGHTGFKGGWLSLWLQSLGAELTGFALAPSAEQPLFACARVGDHMQSVIGDIRDGEALGRALARARPEIVLHLAAQPLVRTAYQSPVETFATNVMGTVNLLEAARATPEVRAVVVVTTDKCYDNREWAWPYRESDPLGGHDPYSASKACAELVSACWRNAFLQSPGAAGIATARAGNVIGGGDGATDRLLPDILAAFAAGRPVRIRRPEATRPWQHVLEPLAGYLHLAQHLVDAPAQYAGPWNFGPSHEDVRPVRWIVEHMARRWGEDARWMLDEGEHPHEAGQLALDSSRARQLLGWQPRFDIEQALDLTLDWSRAHARGEDMRARSLEQISIWSAHAPRS